MSDANLTAVAVSEEATLGGTINNPAFEGLNLTTPSLKFAASSVVSNTLRSDRQVQDLIRTAFSAEGGIAQEVSYGCLDTLMRGALFTEWTNKGVRTNVAGQNPLGAASTTQYTFTAASTQPLYNQGAIAARHLLRASGWTTAGNNGRKLVTAATATTATISGGLTVETTAAGDNKRIKVIGFQGASGDIVAAGTAGASPRLTSTALDFTTLGLVVGEVVKIGGPVAGEQFILTPANNDYCRISAIAANTLSFDSVPASWAADAGTGQTVTVYIGDYVRNGTTRRSFLIEYQYVDIPEYEYFKGMVVSSCELKITAQEIMTADFQFMGTSAANVGGTRGAVVTASGQTFTPYTGTATDVAPPTNNVLEAGNNVGAMRENGTPVPGANYVVGASVKVDNTLRRRKSVGSLATVDIGVGRCLVTGTLNMYYGSNAILSRIRNNTASSVGIAIDDPNGNGRGYFIDLPKIKFTDGNPTTPGVDQDRMLDSPFQALRDPVLGYTMHLQRFEELYNV